MAFEFMCNQGLCCERPLPGSLYCKKHSSPGWEDYRHYRRIVIGVLVGLTVIPLLIVAMSVAWRLAVLAVAE